MLFLAAAICDTQAWRKGVTTMYVCLCKGITSGRIRKLGESGVDTPGELIRVLGLDQLDECCGFCMFHIGRMVAIARGGDPLEYGRFTLDPATRVEPENPDDAP